MMAETPERLSDLEQDEGPDQPDDPEGNTAGQAVYSKCNFALRMRYQLSVVLLGPAVTQPS